MSLSDKLKVDGLVDVELFADAVRRAEPVGMCSCGGWLAGRITRTRRVTFLDMTCQSCGTESSSPAGRLLARPAFVKNEPRPVDPVMAAAWAEVERRRMGERDDDAA
jgi:hypothetical protein